MIQINNIILADDDSEDAYIFKECIKEINPSIQLEIVRNGNGLMSLLRDFHPDLIFLDLDMPLKNGLDCLTAMNELESLQTVPKIIFSSTHKPANIDLAYELGAHLFMTKSGTFKEQCSKLSALLRLEWGHPQEVKDQYFINGRYTAFM